MKDILDGLESVLNKNDIFLSPEVKEEMFEELRLIYKRIEGSIIDRHVDLIDNDFEDGQN